MMHETEELFKAKWTCGLQREMSRIQQCSLIA